MIQNTYYPIHFTDSLQALQGFISVSSYSKVIVLVDSNTDKHCLPVLAPYLPDTYEIIEIDPGEENKNIDFCIGIWQNLLDFGVDRNSLLVNLGGGVITDIGGFAASTFKRGIDFVQIPTTLLAQVDASVGGKTGIDLGNVKNIVGTFRQPKAVFIHIGFLKSLDSRQMLSGYAEIIKHGLIYDAALFERIRVVKPDEVTEDIIFRSVEIKNEVVTADPMEKGLRKILNFGHTIGHAVESLSLETTNPLLHGEAIAVGMICEAYLSWTLNSLPETALNEISGYLIGLYGKVADIGLNEALIEIMQNDKKNDQGNIGFALLSRIGKCEFNRYANESDIIESLDYYRGL